MFFFCLLNKLTLGVHHQQLFLRVEIYLLLMQVPSTFCNHSFSVKVNITPVNLLSEACP
jgi:hypothetical protein